MKQFSFFLGFLLFSTLACAGTYMIERDDGQITVVEYLEGSKDSMEDVLRSFGLEGKPAIPVDRKDLPPRSDRKYWKKDGNNVGVDLVKKQIDIDAAAQAEAEKEAVLLKLKITKEEFEKLK